ncbi:MAG TPA: proton-conducting transporter membrane subunit, partial [Chitinophaga sp.]
THWTFLAGCLAIAGIPGFSGFFSKDAILASAFASNKIIYVLGLLGALMTAFYMFRLYYITFCGSFRGTHEQEHHLHESPAAMTIPLVILALLSIFGGYIGLPEVFGMKNLLGEYLAPIFAPSAPFAAVHELEHATEWLLMGLSSVLVIVMIFWARAKYRNYQPSGAENTGLLKVLENKWYVDELYDAVIVRPLLALGQFFSEVMEKMGIDRLVNGIGRSVQWGGQQLRVIQNGQVGFYVFAMVLGMIVLLVIGLLF